jgi:CDP-diacylglycerol--glycerol-3-phosphate 3-phosphatidyltransferase
LSSALSVFVGILAAALASMVVFAALGSSRDRDAGEKGAQFLGGAGNFLVHWFMWVIAPAERLSLRLGLSPDFFNFAGLGFGLASGVLIGLSHLELGGWAIALGGVCDILDGRIARATKVDSLYGKFIDSTLDRYVEVFAFIGFAIYLRGFALGPPTVVTALAGSLLVSYTRARGESLGVLCTKGLMQRAERLVLTCLACLIDPSVSRWAEVEPGTLLLWVLGLIALTTMGTAAYRTAWIARRLRTGSPESDRERQPRA